MKPAIALLFLIPLAAALSQTPRKPFIGDGDNPANELKFENDVVRVVVDTELPFEKTGFRERVNNRVLVYLDEGHLQLDNADGRVEDMAVQRGFVQYSRAGVPYVVENLSQHPVRIVEIELKTPRGGRAPAPSTDLDPTKIDPAHYVLESENPQIRVLKVHFGPHEKSPLHEHQLDRVVVYLNDQGQFKEGDVRMAGAQKHTEENAGDKDADRIAIEIK